MKFKAAKIILLICILLNIIFTSSCFITTQKTVLTTDTKQLLTDSSLSMHVIDVGQGDSVLLESKGSYMLIDAGEYSEAHSTLSYLNILGVTELEYVVVTHPHSDHCGDMLNTLKAIPAKEIIMPNVSHNTKTWENLVDYVTEEEIPVNEAISGDIYRLGDTKITILAPNSDKYDDLNNYSVAIKAEYEKISFLLTGDAEEFSENEMIKSGADLSCTVLKLGHHGSATSSSKDFLVRANPSFGVISCGKDNSYGHPHKETLLKCKELNIPLYRTDELGTIVFSSDGSKLSVTSESESTKDLNFNNSPLSSSNTTGSQENTSIKDNSSKDNDDLENEEYVGNKKSKIYHKSSCDSVNKMSEKNKIIINSKAEAENEGYSPCKNCNS